MRTSRRGLMFKFLIVAGLIFTWLVTGAALDAQAQGIQGLPGSAADATQGRVVHENKLGSVLFFNYYTSDALSAAVNTRITITNVHPTQDIAIHVFFVDSNTCNIADAFICLTGNQTTTFVASDLDPNVTGYLIAVAVDTEGRPVSFNYLAGDELVVTPTGHRFGLAAMAAARRDGNYASPINADGISATMFFNASQYDLLPYTMVLDGFPSQVAGVGAPLADTRLYAYTPLPDLITGSSAFSGTLFFLVHDDAENTFSGQLPINCYIPSDKQRIPSVRTSPPMNTIVPSGRTGWATFYAIGNRTILCDPSGSTKTLANVPLMGATATKVGSYSGGHNLRYATAFPEYSITIPVIPPGCPTVAYQTQGNSLCQSK
ncbi:MAG: hypothetical protein JNJ50_27195 [Acidobacteria bacterium]|nr:hypothetical protein [Acidobacteriota bacterium]